MAGLGSAAGGPSGMRPDPLGNPEMNSMGMGSKQLLNTHIHNYFMEEGLVELAKAIRQDNRLAFAQDKLLDRTRKGANGVDDSMDSDNKDDVNRMDGLPGSLGQGNPGDSFLATWWGIFWDMWSAARHRNKDDPSPSSQYLAATQVQRARVQQSQQLLQQSAMMQPNFQYRPMMPNQMDLQKRAMVNNGRMNPGAMQNMRLQQQMAAQSQMQRDSSEMEMNPPQRGHSPMPGDNAPSPKRARIDSGSFNPQQMGPNGRAPGMVPQPPNGNAPNATMLINSSFDPNSMSPAFNQLNGQPKSAQQVYAQELVNHQRSAMGALPKGVTPTNGMSQGSPMMGTGPDGQMMQTLPADMFPPGAGNNMRGGPGLAAGNGGALADYQMQLMLLEQQNKKRLMMARQEQDVALRSDNNGVPMPNYAPAMSPRGSRTGHSPGSNDPNKRATPKMNQDSPLADGTMGGNRASPAPSNFDQGPMQPNMVQPFNMMGGPNGMMMRPGVHPGNAQMNPQHQHQMDILRQQHAMRVPNGSWGPGMQNPGQMLPQGQMLQQPPMDMNQQRNNMPPPQGPPAGRTQPPSPQQSSAAPPTPSQGNKANPKAKKDNKDTKKKQNKKASTTTGATPNAEAEQSDDVPPPTPSTPKNAASNLIKGTAPQGPNMTMQPQPPVSIPSSAMGMGAPQDNNSMPGPFSSLGAENDMSGFGDFDDLLGGQDSSDVLSGFDFDAFLHQDPVPGFDFDATQYLGGDGLESGMGQ